jgi:hypothetical protein
MVSSRGGEGPGAWWYVGEAQGWGSRARRDGELMMAVRRGAQLWRGGQRRGGSVGGGTGGRRKKRKKE